MAKFEGIRWASQQLRYGLYDKTAALLPADAPTPACSRSTNYAIFLCFEGIRYFCARGASGGLELRFLNLRKNLERFHRGIAFNIGSEHADWVPSAAELESIFLKHYLRAPALRPFFEEMAGQGAQGYLRPFTVDDEQSIGVTFPNMPTIRVLASRYDRYLGEPFAGVVVPNLVRAVALNKTGCLKLGINYLISVKAVEAARTVEPGAAAALFLDDQNHLPVEDRQITEWDSSCCLFAFRDGTVVKIPEGPLILPSVTIQGITAILRHKGVKVEERHLSYGELLRRAKAGELVTVCSIGTAGILNRCAKLVLVDGGGKVAAVHVPDERHPLYSGLAEARQYYWDIYRGLVPPLAGLSLDKYEI
jgi:branched-subunit amino acid aminotransferase/4-amino-4-deoxychorismate lyase